MFETIIVSLTLMCVMMFSNLMFAILDSDHNNDCLFFYYLYKYKLSVFTVVLLLCTPIFTMLILLKRPKSSVEKPLEEKKVDYAKTTYRKVVYLKK